MNLLKVKQDFEHALCLVKIKIKQPMQQNLRSKHGFDRDIATRQQIDMIRTNLS